MAMALWINFSKRVLLSDHESIVKRIGRVRLMTKYMKRMDVTFCMLVHSIMIQSKPGCQTRHV